MKKKKPKLAIVTAQKRVYEIFLQLRPEIKDIFDYEIVDFPDKAKSLFRFDFFICLNGTIDATESIIRSRIPNELYFTDIDFEIKKYQAAKELERRFTFKNFIKTIKCLIGNQE